MSQELVISPPMEETPEIRMQGKTLVIEFMEELRENTTYTLSFGETIKDLNEGNILRNFEFVFSTGEKLDSLGVLGMAVQAFDLKSKPIASICVGALPIAHSGALTGRCATTYHLDGSPRRQQLAGYEVEVLDDAIVVDGNIITSTSPATAVEVALALVETLTDEANASHVRHLMGFHPNQA